MKQNTIIIITDAGQVPYIKFRETVIWKSAKGNTLLTNMDESHIKNILRCIDMFSCTSYNGFSHQEWRTIFKTELQYRRDRQFLDEINKNITIANKKMLRYY